MFGFVASSGIVVTKDTAVIQRQRIVKTDFLLGTSEAQKAKVFWTAIEGILQREVEEFVFSYIRTHCRL